MDDILHLTLLYDFYGELLTEKQKQVYEMQFIQLCLKLLRSFLILLRGQNCIRCNRYNFIFPLFHHNLLQETIASSSNFAILLA